MNAFEWTTELRFLVALALGFLVGLERESTKLESQKMVFGGVRTHPIISMFGFGCAWLYKVGVTFMLPVGLLTVGALTSIAYIAKIRSERFGSTSEISALATFITGAMALLVDVWASMAIGVMNTLLLSEKAMLESYVERLNRVEFLAATKFLLVTVIIYPVLPNQEYTQFGLNPTKIWQIVILVSTLGFVGYYLQKRFGERIGLWMSGVFGGLVSSTAVTVAVGRIAGASPERGRSALQSSLLASSVSYLRVLVLIWVVNYSFVADTWWRLLLLAGIGVILSIRIGKPSVSAADGEVHGLQNPFEIRPAVGFGILFVALTILTDIVQTNLGDSGTLALSAIVGVTDITPFILSIIHGNTAILHVFTSAIILSTMSNTVAKGIYFGFLSRGMWKETAWRYGVWALLHIPLVIF
ncbi:MAG TPA: MgtC/SapB family protein [Bacteroidota bacterium]|nr:MgtC/SapB family protein [Bacteroidota bacterium]